MTFESHAQNYEDYILAQALGDVADGFYVDIGANDPDFYSVSKHFYEAGWRGIEVEPLPDLAQRLREKRARSEVFEVAVGSENGTTRLYRFAPPNDGLSTFDEASANELAERLSLTFDAIDVDLMTMDEVLKVAPPEHIHWAKIDVEGAERAVLEGFDLKKWRPWVLVVEATKPVSTEVVHDEWEHLIIEAGYSLALFDGLNRYYISPDHHEVAARLNRPVSVLDNVRGPHERETAEALEASVRSRDALSQAHEAADKEVSRLNNLNVEAQGEIDDLRSALSQARTALEHEMTKNRASQQLKGFKKIKAKIAIRLLKQFPADPNAGKPSRLRKKLTRWAARAENAGPITVTSAIAARAAQKPTSQAVSPETGRGQLALSPSYGIARSAWDQFLAQLPQEIRDHDGPRRKLTILVEDQQLVTQGQSQCFEIHYATASSDQMAEQLGSLDQDDWVLFAHPHDSLRLQACDRLAAPQMAEAHIVLPDLTLIDGDHAHPLLAPGANYLYAINCPIYISRFFARAGAVQGAMARGAAKPEDIALDLLADAQRSRRHDRARAAGLPMIDIPGGPDMLQTLREDLVAQDAIRVASLRGHIPSTDVDVSQMGGVSVVICTKDKGFYIQNLVNALLDYPAELVRDIIIVSNNTTNLHALETLRRVAKQDRVKLLRYDAPFHFSAQSNLGAQHATGSYLLFLNDDIIPIGERWLEELMAPFEHPDVVASGPLLLYPDERVQHCGMVIGSGDVAGHVLAGHQIPEEEFNFLASAPRYVSAVTGAALLVRKSDFMAVGGFDLSLRLWIQDLDLCMRLAAGGGQIAFNPKSTLFHMESLTVRDTLHDSDIGRARTRELQHFRNRWPNWANSDLFHPALLDKQTMSCRVLGTK